MASDAQRILEEALKLPPGDRAAIAGSLIDSLDDPADPDAEARWAEEIERRLDEIESGNVKPVSWSVARRATLGE